MNNRRSDVGTIFTTSDHSGNTGELIDSARNNSTSKKGINMQRDSTKSGDQKRKVKFVKHLALLVNIVGVVICCALLINRTTICIVK